MPEIEITIGWSRPTFPGQSTYDGWVPGTKQHTETIIVNVESDIDPYEIAEQIFYVTNCRVEDYVDSLSVGGQVDLELERRGFDGSQSGHYSLSVGDTVTVGEVMLACDRFGWKVVHNVG